MDDKEKRRAAGEDAGAEAAAPKRPASFLGALRSDDPGVRLMGLSDLPGREAVVIGFVFRSESPGDPDRYSRSGHYVLGQKHERTRRAILGVILESARFQGVRVPDLFTPDVAELFYAGGRLEEVRLGGHAIRGSDDSGDPIYVGVMTDPAPAFEVAADGRIVLAHGDSGRSYLAAYRNDDSLVVSWDIKDQGDAELRPEAVYCTFAVGPGDAQAAGAPREIDARLLAETEVELRGKSVEELRDWLRLPEPVEVRDPNVIQVSERFRRLTYVYETEDARCQLSDYYANNADLSERTVREVAAEESVPPDRARAMLMLRHRQARDEFVESNLEEYVEQSTKILEDVFEGLLKGEVNSLSAAGGMPPGTSINLTRDEVLKAQRKDTDRMTADRMGLPRPGRPKGARPKRSSEKAEAKRAGNKRRMEAAIGKLLLARAGPDGKKIGIAISELTAEKVGKVLKKHPSTVYRWAKQGWGDFETAKIEVGVRLRFKK
jgi:hypothetical protein